MKTRLRTSLETRTSLKYFVSNCRPTLLNICNYFENYMRRISWFITICTIEKT